MGIDNTMQLDLLRILSGILHLGQIQFSGDSEQSTVDKVIPLRPYLYLYPFTFVTPTTVIPYFVTPY